MKIIISPAKKMNRDVDSLPWQDLPQFLPRTREVLARLREMGEEELQKLWKCNDSIARLNIDRLVDMDLEKNLTPAILAYEGIQYQYMAPGVFTADQFTYIQEHLRILSGFYGLLRPFDGVVPYRLEMQAKLKVAGAKDLYAYWGDSLAKALCSPGETVVNLASKEYSQCISRHLSPDTPFLTCVFGEEKDGKIIEKGTMCKMARGEMVRYMAEHHITRGEELTSFDRLDYRFDPDRSDAGAYVFLRQT